jgi:hypothetical protein
MFCNSAHAQHSRNKITILNFVNLLLMIFTHKYKAKQMATLNAVKITGIQVGTVE